jgi:ribosomal protein S18 acetylase RimI-like enzyme
MTGIKIDFLKDSDWDQFVSLFLKQLFFDFPNFPQEGKKFFLEKKYKNLKSAADFLKNKQVFLAKTNETILGFLMAHQVPGGVSVCDWLWVDKSHRQQGIGRLLVVFWEEYNLKDKKIHKLNVSTTNQDNIFFYKKLGFKLEGTREKDQWGVNRYLLGKLI